MSRPRAVAWAAFILGVAASIAANVAHARPEAGPRLAAGFAPVALLGVIEMLARVPWPAGGRWRAGKWLGASVVATVAAVTSYRHMSALLLAYGEDALTATILPLAVDGLMVVASVALMAMGARRQAGAQDYAPGAPERPEPGTDERQAGEEISSPEAPATPPVRPVPDAPEQAPESQASQRVGRQRTAPEVAEEARQMYAASVAAGDPLSGRQVGRMYQRSASWGRERIAEVKRAESASETANR